ncbi:MAG: hypothetical protein ACI9OJ_005976 [Myxococcota bacterium]|jgi:hypothetical protein
MKTSVVQRTIVVCALLCAIGCSNDDSSETSAADALSIDVVPSEDGQPDVLSAPDVLATPDTAEPVDVLVSDMTEPDTSPPDAAADTDQPHDIGLADDEPVDVLTDAMADAGEMDATEPADVGTGPDVGIAAKCFSEIFDGEAFGPNYDQCEFTVGEHCLGTNRRSAPRGSSSALIESSVS